MTDIVERLRARNPARSDLMENIELEAATEIETLRVELAEEIKNHHRATGESCLANQAKMGPRARELAEYDDTFE